MKKEDMGSTIRARFSDGTLKPLEALELKEGDEVTITIVSSSSSSRAGADWLEQTAGGWVGLVDSEELKREIYDSRLIATRAEPRL
jgi:predicted DNA-binding antitoxin AbrB/MazE fold protein